MIDALPFELLVLILEYLDRKSLLHLGFSSQRMKDRMMHPYLRVFWKKRVGRPYKTCLEAMEAYLLVEFECGICNAYPILSQTKQVISKHSRQIFDTALSTVWKECWCCYGRVNALPSMKTNLESCLVCRVSFCQQCSYKACLEQRTCTLVCPRCKGPEPSCQFCSERLGCCQMCRQGDYCGIDCQFQSMRI